MKQTEDNSAAPRSIEEYPVRVRKNRRRFWQIAAAAVLTAALIAACWLLAGGSADAVASAQIRITEVVSSNAASLQDAAGGSPDWIELHNPSDSDITLSGYFLMLDNDTTRRGKLDGVTIPAGGYAVVYAADTTPDGTACTGFSLPRGGCTLRLVDADSNVLQTLAVPALYTDMSYANNAATGGFGYCLSPTPGAANDTEITTLQALAECAQGCSLAVTEAMPDPSEGSAWIEIRNTGDTDTYLGVFYLADDSGDSSPYRLPDATLAPGEYALIYAGGADIAFSVPFRLGADDSGVYLYDVTGTLRSALTWDTPPGADTSVVAADTYTKHPTPGADNSTDVFSLSERASMDASDAVRLSEVLTDNAHSLRCAAGDRCAWAEVCNHSDAPVSLSGYYLSDDAADPLKWAFPDTTLEAGSYAVVPLSGAGEGMEASFRLSAGESTLYLTEIATMRTDAFALPQEAEQDVSVVRAQDGTAGYAYPTPGADNAECFASLADMRRSRAQGVILSEVCAADADADWIELYNGSDTAADLSGWYLSDDADDPQKWQIPSLIIAAGGYTVITADGATENAAPFGIAISGETLLLTRADGALVDAMDTGLLRSGLTSGRVAGDATLARVFFTQPTPGAQNAEQAYESYAAAPVLSETGLYHTGVFSLSLATATPGASIYYTLDGSEPDETDTLYAGAIAIDANATVRAAAIAPGLLPSDVTTATYLFEEPHTIPVVCLSGEPSEMRDIFVNADRRHKPEHGGNMEYYETDGTLGVSFTTGIKSKGRSSLEYGQKSVTLCLGEEYGRNEVSYPFFETGTVTTFSELTLRNGGQDYFGSRLRDSFIQQLSQGMDVNGIRTRIVAVYVNGEYWGLYDLEEEQEEGYFEAYYGLSYDDIDMVDRNNTVRQGSADGYLEARSAARSWNLSDDAVFAEFAKLVDVDSCTNYLIINTFFGNGDVINQRFWNARDGSEGWQPLLFDLDWCMRFNSAYRDTFSRYFSSTGSAAGNGTITNMDIFYGLKRNAAWRDAFIDRYIEVAYTVFDTDRVLAMFDETVAEMEPEMARHIARWHTHRSVNAWLDQTELMRAALEKRRDIALRDMASAFGLSSTELQARVDAFTSTH